MKASRARRDESEKEIVDVLEARGYRVMKLAQKGLPDLLVWRSTALPYEFFDPLQGVPYLIECKTGTRKLREQTQNWDALGLRVDVLRNADEAMRWNR